MTRLKEIENMYIKSRQSNEKNGKEWTQQQSLNNYVWLSYKQKMKSLMNPIFIFNSQLKYNEIDETWIPHCNNRQK